MSDVIGGGHTVSGVLVVESNAYLRLMMQMVCIIAKTLSKTLNHC